MRSHWGFCVVGAGNGGCAMAVDLALRGFPVTLYSSDKGKLVEVERLGLTVEGAIEGAVRCMRLTNSPREAAEQARVIMVVVPAFMHSVAAERFAPYLEDGHVVVLNPGRTLGAVEFEHVLRENGCLAQVTVSEAQSLLYASRIVGPGRVRVFSVKRRVEVAALPSWRTQEVVKVLNQAWPQFVAADNLLETSLDNIGAILHPTPTILNVSRIEAGDPFDYYHEGVSPTVAHLLGCLDAERLAVARSLGVRVRSLAKWLEDAYGSTGSNLYE
ncbi:MAG: NAD/NADP octopine/nopaline dehydrogenase family protein, partial [Thermodesulfobacteriota bacterium]